jgi:hypothetical protein
MIRLSRKYLKIPTFRQLRLNLKNHSNQKCLRLHWSQMFQNSPMCLQRQNCRTFLLRRSIRWCPQHRLTQTYL